MITFISFDRSQYKLATKIITRRVPLVEQELFTLPEHLSSTPVFNGIRVTRSLVLYVYFVDHFLSICTFFFWPLCCLFFFEIGRKSVLKSLIRTKHTIFSQNLIGRSIYTKHNYIYMITFIPFDNILKKSVRCCNWSCTFNEVQMTRITVPE
jgi:hypothetical protein